jgi:AraC-like DNA-binding protein
VLRLRTDDWPERDRIAMFREEYGRDRIRIEPGPNEPLRIDATFVKWPGLGLMWGRRSALRSEFSDGNDRLMLDLGGDALATQSGRDVVLTRGDAIALSGSEVGSLTTFRTGRIATVEFPNGALLPLLGGPASPRARRIPKDAPVLRLLRGYLRSFCADGGTAVARLQQLAIAHIYHLAAVALGASRETAEIANGRGIRAARLQALKNDIEANLQHDISLTDIAARHRVSARYLRMLFASEGTSFTAFIPEERLKRAHRMLLSRRFDHLGIGIIAFEVGFNDLSHFNRTFRRRFGRSPRELREDARGGTVSESGSQVRPARPPLEIP